MSFFIITTKTPLLSSLLISLYCKSVKGGFYTKTDISADRDCFINILAEVR